MTWTQTTLTLKDANGNNQPVIAYTDGTSFSFAHPILDNTGAVIAPATQGTLASVLTALQAATPAGTNVIGKVTTDQTTHGTTDLIAADITKVAGAAFALGQQVAGSSLPVVLTAAQITALTAPVLGTGANVIGGITVADGSDATVGAKADSAATTDTGTFSLIALVKRLLTTLTSVYGNQVPVPGVIPLTVGTTATAGRSLAVNCTAAGNVAVTFSDGSTSSYPVAIGLNVFPFAVTKVNTSGTTATATYENWK